MLRRTCQSVRAGLRKYKLRYDPRRVHMDVDDETLALMSQLGYIEVFRGEYIITESGYDMFQDAVDAYKEKYFADVRS